MLKIVPNNSIVCAIYIASSAVDAPMPIGGHSQINKAIFSKKANLVKNMGIVGDRWFGVNSLLRKDGEMIPNDHARNITFFEQEKIKEIQEMGFDIQPEDLRRSVLVKNFPLNDMVGKVFSIGGVRFIGSRLSHGCDRIEKMLKIDGINKALYMRGGIRAAILNDGIIKVGNKIYIE
jgi:hypothetical protein